GYRQEKGVSPDSKVETFAALQLEVDSWRWKGVPFYIRAGKNLPVTCTEVLGRFRKPPTVIRESALSQNYLRFRISPEMTIAVGTTVMAPGEVIKGETVEMVASRHPRPDEMEAYERVLGDAMAGDATLFAREMRALSGSVPTPLLLCLENTGWGNQVQLVDTRFTNRSSSVMAGTAMPRSHRGPGISPVTDWVVYGYSLSLDAHCFAIPRGRRDRIFMRLGVRRTCETAVGFFGCGDAAL